MRARATSTRAHDVRRGMQSLTAVLIAVLAVATGCSGSSSSGGKESASGFVQRITTEFSRGQSGRLWDELAPADQALVSRSRYSNCEGNEGFVLKNIKVLDTYSEPVDVNGATEPSDAVSLQVTSDTGVTTATLHAVSVRGTWRWILSPADRAAYARGTCP